MNNTQKIDGTEPAADVLRGGTTEELNRRIHDKRIFMLMASNSGFTRAQAEVLWRLRSPE